MKHITILTTRDSYDKHAMDNFEPEAKSLLIFIT